MNDVLGSILPLAVAVMISPVAIIAEILLLFTARRIPNAGAFVIGFAVGVIAFLGLLVVIAGTQDLSTGSGPSTVSSVLRIVLGVVLLVGATRQFRARPAPGQTAASPKWMDGIESFHPGRSLLVGLVIGAVNPKNIAMAIGASVAVAAAELSTGQSVAAVAIYALVAALGVTAPFAVAVVMRGSAQPILDGWKAWLGQNNATVMAVLFLVFGVVLISQGIENL